MIGGPRLTLNNSVEMPALGFGTYKSNGDTAKMVIHTALETGYRHIDTAWDYRNEKEIGEAVRESGIPRSEVFITSKLSVNDQGYQEALDACYRGLDNMGLDYFDLYLIHWPVIGKWQASWEALLRLSEEGRCRCIGVSNFQPRVLDELLRISKTAPAVNQIELTPFRYDKTLVSKCVESSVKLECFSPLTRGAKFEHPAILELSAKYGKSPAQILIRWGLDHGFAPLPKATAPERIKENFDVFDFTFTLDELRQLDGLDEDYTIVRPEYSGQFDGFGVNR